MAKGSQPDWEYRAQIISKLIRATDRLLDIGAGNQKLVRHVPGTCKYTAVDCVSDIPGTFVVDFNQDFRLPETDFNVIVCAGVLEYLNDVPAFFRNLAERAPGCQVIFTYLFDPSKMSRQTMKVSNNFRDSNDFLNEIGRSFLHIDAIAFDRLTAYYTGTLSSAAGPKTVNPTLITDFFSHTTVANCHSVENLYVR